MEKDIESIFGQVKGMKWKKSARMDIKGEMNIKASLFDADRVVINSCVFSEYFSEEFNVPIEDMIPFFK